MLCLVQACCLWSPQIKAQDADKDSLPKLEAALVAVEDETSAARQRLAMRRVIRNGEEALKVSGDQPERWATLEFLFRARQRLVSLDEDPKHRQDLLETCRELVKAPDAFAALRLEADLLLTQVEQAKKGNSPGDRANALRPFVERYVGTPAGAKALRAAMVMALELGDSRLINDLRAIIAKHYSSDLEMISFLRDHLGGQVFGVPFVGDYKRSDGKRVCFPMDALGHSSMVIFWSKDSEEMLQYLANLAAAGKLGKDSVDGYLEIISINLDQLPDAGESIIRGLGADWQCLHFPGGRDNPIYKAYVRRDPLNLRVAPTGQCAMVLAGTTRPPPKKKPEEIQESLKQIKPSENLEALAESFRRALIRGWSNGVFALHLSALMAGDFLIFDPEGFDVQHPPEIKAAAKEGEVAPLQRSADCVPEEKLQAIQACLIAAPQRYLAKAAEIRAAYEKMRDLCLQVIADHPAAPDLWIVRNRLITAELGLWKTNFDLTHFEAAVAQSRKAMDVGYPKGCDVIARFCLARQALRDPGANAAEVIDAYVADQGGEQASGPVLATASLLALDAADEARYRKFRKVILSQHTEHPMMWLYSSFLLSRSHDYWMFQVPFEAGWSFGRREKYEMNKGDAEDAGRMLKAELPTVDGKVLRIPEDLKADYTAIYIGQPSPWRGGQREDNRPTSPSNILRNSLSFILSRPDVDLWVAMLGDCNADEIRQNLQPRNSKEPLDFPILQIPGGMTHPLVHRLGLLSDEGAVAVVDRRGRILTVLTGSTFNNAQQVVPATVESQDERVVMEDLKRGELEAAKKRIMQLAPPYDPEAVDERGRKLPLPKYSLAHLRARARVYMAMNEWDKALEDAEAVVSSQLGAAGGMSLRTPELDESEALRDEIKAKAIGREP